MRILIIGAGFAGIYAALSAARLRDIQGVSPKSSRSRWLPRSRRWWFALGFTNRSPKH